VSRAIALLGLTHANQCDDKTIQAIWKRKLLKTHPDKSDTHDATRLTQEINAAKDFLLQQAKHVLRAHLDGRAARERQAAADEELRAGMERARRAAADEELRAERARQAAKRREQSQDLFRAMHAEHNSNDMRPYELQQSINQCVRDNLNYEQMRMAQRLRARYPASLAP